ncbi:MAG: GNAT family N-acetyltransferase, partial [Bradyrhizobium sp.]|nr:GNAT family N-acetyltransferase [Bradyrhizobium sp.]
MMLNVRPAKSDEHAFAWPMYQAYISDHIFPKHQFAAPKGTWQSDEKNKFQKAWQKDEPYIIEIDGASIGWLSISKQNNKLTIQNIFIDEPWQDKGVGERIIREMIPTWKAEKRVVE